MPQKVTAINLQFAILFCKFFVGNIVFGQSVARLLDLFLKRKDYGYASGTGLFAYLNAGQLAVTIGTQLRMLSFI